MSSQTAPTIHGIVSTIAHQEFQLVFLDSGNSPHSRRFTPHYGMAVSARQASSRVGVRAHDETVEGWDARDVTRGRVRVDQSSGVKASARMGSARRKMRLL